ncbi:MAG: preprotein translocase subunit SecE [Chloroflexi bacterium]|nr:preprotein translocase subunit SecE [Chloroflexota bacterium]
MRAQTSKAPSVGGVQAAKKGNIADFFVQTFSEFKKVVWPSRQEATRLTAIVIAITASLGIILGAIDFGFTRLIGILGGGPS